VVFVELEFLFPIIIISQIKSEDFSDLKKVLVDVDDQYFSFL
jgi:hypothetical protein